jgi:hypothetical protein
MEAEHVTEQIQQHHITKVHHIKCYQYLSPIPRLQLAGGAQPHNPKIDALV